MRATSARMTIISVRPRESGDPSWIPACAGMSGEFCFPKPYATSHEELDADKAIQEEVR
jgi:hypothetical protein